MGELTDVDSTARGNSKNRLQKGRGIGAKNANSSEALLFQEISQAACTVCGLAVCSAKDLIVCGDVVNCLGLYYCCLVRGLLSKACLR
jgi:hypothetical protein